MKGKGIQKFILHLLILSLIFTGITIPAKSKAAETFMVFFDSQGGSQCDYITDIPLNSRIKLPKPEKEGYVFSGWYKDKDCTTWEVFTEYSGVTENMLLYAKWVEKPITKIVTEYIGEPIVINNIVDKEDLIVTIHYSDGTKKVVEKEDYEIENALIQVVGSNFVNIRCKNRSSYVWIKGIKEPILCIGFDTMGGSAVAPITGIARNSYIQLPEKPTKKGYVFDGWYMEKTYKTQFTAKDPIDETFIVYAKWIKEGEEPTGSNTDSDNEDENELKVLEKEVLELNMTHASVGVGGTESIFVQTVNPYLEVYYESMNEKIAQVDSDGIVTGIKNGRTTIKVYAEGGHTFTCKVGVGTKQYITNLETNVEAKQVKKGKTYQIETEITPEVISQKNISYSSSNTSIATVSSNGLVKAKKKGVCYITVKSTDGTNIKKKVKIRVI